MSRAADRRWTARAVLARALEVVREQGLGSLWFKVLGETVYRRATLVERPLDEPVRPVAMDLQVDVRLLDPAHGDEYLRLRPDTPRSELLRRLDAGHLCVAVWHEERIVSACWTAFHRVWIDHLSRWLELAPDEGFEYEAYTLPELRGRNLAPVRFALIASHLRSSGHRRTVGVVMPESTEAMRTQAKVGYRPIGTLGWVGVGPWRRHFMRIDRGARAPGAPATQSPSGA